MDDKDLQKLHAIIGEAIKGLVDSGAAAESIGSFAMSYPQKVAELLGVTLPALNREPDLVEVVAQAVELVLDRREAAAQSKTKASQKPGRARVVNVIAQGRRTTVTIKADLLRDLQTVKGSEEKALAAIKEMAAGAPDNVDKLTVWLDTRLRSMLAFDGVAPPSEIAH